MTLYVLGFIRFDRESILSMERLCLSDPERDESGVLRPVVILILILMSRVLKVKSTSLLIRVDV
jgi:hypothetical protein